jgi:hypothetical protein
VPKLAMPRPARPHPRAGIRQLGQAL